MKLTVSIHAPTRGATDVRSISLQGGIYRFNSRTHAGCDKNKNDKKIKKINVSIHAPTRGATSYYISII